ncbi:hypothetical protein TNCV_1383751 [Trichonephila clavipes]|nr:hypothetical protein TNCV_1383751 [Trichonephila clavipes]
MCFCASSGACDSQGMIPTLPWTSSDTPVLVIRKLETGLVTKDYPSSSSVEGRVGHMCAYCLVDPVESGGVNIAPTITLFFQSIMVLGRPPVLDTFHFLQHRLITESLRYKRRVVL